MAAACRGGGDTKVNGNCTNPGPDGFVVQCVGPWAKDKHDYLQRYVAATRGARAKFLEPSGTRPAGGAAFIDLFAGPGRARVRTTGEIISGSPLIAAQQTKAAFTHLLLADLDGENIAALKARLGSSSRVELFHGDCNEQIAELAKRVPPHGLNIALIDPYGLRPLRFETISALAAIQRMDFLLHFPTMDLKRNFHQADAFITQFLGTDSWKTYVQEPQHVVRLIEVLRSQLAPFGYTQANVRSLPVQNSQGGVLYHLVFASKDRLGDKIWESVARTSAKGQKSFF